MRSPQPPYPQVIKGLFRADIEGLRALAIISVVFFHGFPEIFSGGFIGVDIFFAISGYLISSIIIRGLWRNEFEFSDFYIRRIRRIFPSLIVVLLFSFSLGWFVLLPDEFSLLGSYIAGGSIFIDNFLAWSDAGYFDRNVELKPLLQLWSLAIEEQFYFFWPLVLWLAWKIKVNFLTTIILFLAIFFWLNMQGISVNPTATFYAPWTRMWELLSGGLLAYFHIYNFKLLPSKYHGEKIKLIFFRSSLTRNICACIGLVALIYGVFNFDRATVFPGINALVPIFGTLMLISAGPDAVLNKLLLSNKLIVFFGAISYPLYLWHWTLLSFLRIMTVGEPVATLKILAIIFSILLSWATYVYIEKPLRFGGNRAVKTAMLCITLMVCGIAGWFVYIHDGIPSRLAKHYQNISLVNDVKEADEICKEKYPAANRYCLLLNPDKPATVALMGDSHANRLFKSLSTYYSNSNQNLLQIGEAGCLPLLGVESNLIKTGSKCSHFINAQLNYLLTNENIKTIVLTYYGRYYLSGVNLDKPNDIVMNISELYRSNNTNPIDVYRKGLQTTLEKIIKSGKRAILVVDAPDFSYDPKTCVSYSRPYSSIFSDVNSCMKPLSVVIDEDAGYAETTYEVANKLDVKVINLRDSLCKEGVCRATKDGLLLYRDNDHLNPLGASQAVKELWPQFQ